MEAPGRRHGRVSPSNRSRHRFWSIVRQVCAARRRNGRFAPKKRHEWPRHAFYGTVSIQTSPKEDGILRQGELWNGPSARMAEIGLWSAVDGLIFGHSWFLCVIYAVSSRNPTKSVLLKIEPESSQPPSLWRPTMRHRPTSATKPRVLR